VIEAHALTKRYGPITAVDQLSFDVRPGVVTGFLGPNGSGKSTTMRLILGLDAADHGTVKVAGHTYRDLRFPLREVGALLEAKAFHPGRSAKAHLQALAASNAIAPSRVDETLHTVGLHSAGQHGAASRKAGQLSLGMAQRLGIAAALLGDPPVLIFDEPVNGPNNILVGGAFGSVLFAVLGVLVMTSEYSSGTIRATLAAIPRRGLVLAAKAAVWGTTALVAGELVTLAGFLAGAAFVHGAVPRPALSQPDVLRAVVLSGVYLCLVGLIGLALGVIIRHGAAAITALVALVFVAPLAGLAATPAGQYLPELIYANALGATKPVQGFTLSPWAGLAIIAAYVVVLLSVGGWLLTRRDA